MWHLNTLRITKSPKLPNTQNLTGVSVGGYRVFTLPNYSFTILYLIIV